MLQLTKAHKIAVILYFQRPIRSFSQMKSEHSAHYISDNKSYPLPDLSFMMILWIKLYHIISWCSVDLHIIGWCSVDLQMALLLKKKYNSTICIM